MRVVAVWVVLGSLACAGLPIPDDAPQEAVVALPAPEAPPPPTFDRFAGIWADSGALVGAFPDGTLWVEIGGPKRPDSTAYEGTQTAPDRLDVICPFEEGCLDGTGHRSVQKGALVVSLISRPPETDVQWGEAMAQQKQPLSRWDGSSDSNCCCILHDASTDTFNALWLRAATCGAHCLPEASAGRCDLLPPEPRRP